MTLKMTRSAVAELRGQRAPDPAPKPAPVPPAPAPAAPDNSALVAMQDALATMTHSLARLPEIIANSQPAPRPAQQLEGIIYRDSKGRMSKVVITLTK